MLVKVTNSSPRLTFYGLGTQEKEHLFPIDSRNSADFIDKLWVLGPALKHSQWARGRHIFIGQAQVMGLILEKPIISKLCGLRIKGTGSSRSMLQKVSLNFSEEIPDRLRKQQKLLCHSFSIISFS